MRTCHFTMNRKQRQCDQGPTPDPAMHMLRGTKEKDPRELGLVLKQITGEPGL